MNVLIATIQYPFVTGGAEIQAADLRDQLQARGIRADIVALPFPWDRQGSIPDLIRAARLIDVKSCAWGPVDRVIGLRFPAYLIPHPHRVLWLIHQHRSAYNLADLPGGVGLGTTEEGRGIQRAIQAADDLGIPEHRRITAISRTVAERLRHYNGIAAEVLYPPPRGADQLLGLDASAEPEPFLYFPSRIAWTKRQDLLARALARTRHPVRVVVSGGFESPDYREVFERAWRESVALRPDVRERLALLGHVSEEEKLRLLERCRAVVYIPRQEDLGYVTLEAMLAGRAVLAARDSGGPTEFVEDGATGALCDPEPEALARALDALWEDPARARRMGARGRERYLSLGISWERVLETLLA